MAGENHRSHLSEKLDIWIPGTLGVAGLVILLVIAERNTSPSPFQLRVYLVLLAVSAAAFAAVIPGLLGIRLSAPGLAIRATGALGVFCVVFFYEPAQQTLSSTLGVPLPEKIPLSFDSGWRGGGSTVEEYCSEQVKSVEKQYPGRRVVVVDTNDDHKSEYTPFKHDYYRYQCFIVVE